MLWSKIHHSVIIHSDSLIGKNVEIGAYVTIYPNVIIKDNVKIMEGAVIGYPPISTGATKRKIEKTKTPTIIGEGSIVLCNAVIYKDVIIGKNCMICDLSSIREGCRIGDKCIIARGVTINYNTRIGNHVKIMDNSHITGGMIIEDDVFISTLVATTNDNTLGRTKGKKEWESPIIRRGASIGASASILPNIEIGEYAIVGSGSVVTKNVKPYTLVMGVPAKIKRRVTK